MSQEYRDYCHANYGPEDIPATELEPAPGTGLCIIEPSTREAGPILVGDAACNDIAEFYHSDHATVGQSYETALSLARKLVEGCGALAQGVRVHSRDQLIRTICGHALCDLQHAQATADAILALSPAPSSWQPIDLTSQVVRLRYAILGYFEVFDRCDGSESVSPETFAAARQGLREALAISSTEGK